MKENEKNISPQRYKRKETKKTDTKRVNLFNVESKQG